MQSKLTIEELNQQISDALNSLKLNEHLNYYVAHALDSQINALKQQAFALSIDDVGTAQLVLTYLAEIHKKNKEGKTIDLMAPYRETQIKKTTCQVINNLEDEINTLSQQVDFTDTNESDINHIQIRQGKTQIEQLKKRNYAYIRDSNNELKPTDESVAEYIATYLTIQRSQDGTFFPSYLIEFIKDNYHLVDVRMRLITNTLTKATDLLQQYPSRGNKKNIVEDLSINIKIQQDNITKNNKYNLAEIKRAFDEKIDAAQKAEETHYQQLTFNVGFRKNHSSLQPILTSIKNSMESIWKEYPLEEKINQADPSKVIEDQIEKTKRELLDYYHPDNRSNLDYYRKNALESYINESFEDITRHTKSLSIKNLVDIAKIKLAFLKELKELNIPRNIKTEPLSSYKKKEINCNYHISTQHNNIPTHNNLLHQPMIENLGESHINHPGRYNSDLITSTTIASYLAKIKSNIQVSTLQEFAVKTFIKQHKNLIDTINMELSNAHEKLSKYFGNKKQNIVDPMLKGILEIQKRIKEEKLYRIDQIQNEFNKIYHSAQQCETAYYENLYFANARKNNSSLQKILTNIKNSIEPAWNENSDTIVEPKQSIKF